MLLLDKVTFATSERYAGTVNLRYAHTFLNDMPLTTSTPGVFAAFATDMLCSSAKDPSYEVCSVGMVTFRVLPLAESARLYGYTA